MPRTRTRCWAWRTGTTTSPKPGSHPPPPAAAVTAAALNEACRAAVAAVRSGQPGLIAARAQGLRLQAAAFAPEDPAHDFLRALAEVVAGEDAEARAAALDEPWRAVLLSVAADCRAPEHDSDWIPAAAARVAQVLRQRDQAGGEALAGQLTAAASLPDLDRAAQSYLHLLVAVLHGADVRAASLRLVEPYRSAYFSLQALLRGTDPRAGLIERVRDNARLVLRSDSPAARQALAASLDEVAATATTAHGGELAAFVGAVRALVAGELDTDPAFTEPDLATAWQLLRRGAGTVSRTT